MYFWFVNVLMIFICCYWLGTLCAETTTSDYSYLHYNNLFHCIVGIFLMLIAYC